MLALFEKTTHHRHCIQLPIKEIGLQESDCKVELKFLTDCLPLRCRLDSLQELSQGCVNEFKALFSEVSDGHFVGFIDVFQEHLGKPG